MGELPNYKNNYRNTVAQTSLDQIAKKEPNQPRSDFVEQAMLFERHLFETLTGEKNSNQFQDFTDFDVQDEYYRIQKEFFKQISGTDQPLTPGTLQKFIEQDKQRQINEQNQRAEQEPQPVVQPSPISKSEEEVKKEILIEDIVIPDKNKPEGQFNRFEDVDDAENQSQKTGDKKAGDKQSGQDVKQEYDNNYTRTEQDRISFGCKVAIYVAIGVVIFGLGMATGYVIGIGI